MISRRWFVLLLLVAAVSCQKDAAPEPPAPPKTPSEVLAFVELDKGKDLGQLRDAANELSPGAGGMVAMGAWSTVDELLKKMIKDPDTIDQSAPMWWIILDPKQFDEPVVLVAKTKDKTTVIGATDDVKVATDKATAVVGTAKAVDLVSAYAFNLGSTQPSGGLRAVVFPGHAVAVYGDDMKALPDSPEIAAVSTGEGFNIKSIVEMYIKAAFVLAEQSERVEFSLRHGDGAVTGRLLTVARKGTAMASFFAEQKPYDFSTVKKLAPVSNAAIIYDGRIRFDSIRPQVMEAIGGMMSMFPTIDAVAYKKLLDVLWDKMSGTMAMAMAMPNVAAGEPTMSMSMVFGVDGDGDIAESWSDFMATMSGKPMEVMGMKSTTTYQPAALTHDGVAIARQETVHEALSGELPPGVAAKQVVYTALAADHMVMAMGDEDGASIKSSIDALRGKGPRFEGGKMATRVFAGAAGAKASGTMLFDMAFIKQQMPAGQVPFDAMSMSLVFAASSMALDLSFHK